MKPISQWTPAELLEDYISYHYMEGNINDEKRNQLQGSAKDYLEQIQALSADLEAIQPIADAEPSENPDQLELNEEEKIFFAEDIRDINRYGTDADFKNFLKGYKIVKQG